MSHDKHSSDHEEIVVFSGGSAKKLFTWNNLFVVLGVMLFVGTGMLKIGIFAVRDMGKAGQPMAEQAVAEAQKLLPGAPAVSLTINGHEYKFNGVPSGQYWTELTGVTYGNGSGGNNSGNGNSDTAPNSDELPPSSPPPDQDPKVVYEKYRDQFIQLVGGVTPDQPDFSLITATNTKTARQLLSNMKGTNVDMVQPQTWSDALEAAVKKAFEACFGRQDLECVRDWNNIQSEVVTDPPGLNEWLKAILTEGDKVNALLRAAGNTNAEEVLNSLLDGVFKQAKVERIARAQALLGTTEPSKTESGVEVQWALAGKTVKVWIEEPNNPLNFVPPEIGGNMGVLDESDVVALIDGDIIYRVSYAVAIKAIPGLTMEMHDKSYTFPDQPALWDSKANPWTPGTPIP
jgi:hypothetical protein